MAIITADITVLPALPAFTPSSHSIDMIAGRHLTFDVESLSKSVVDSVELLSQPAVGRSVLNGKKIFVNLDGQVEAGETSFQIRTTQGVTVNTCTVNVVFENSLQLEGWGGGTRPVHPVNELSGDWEFIEGEGFKRWYIDPTDGMTIANIAIAAGVTEATVKGGWLQDQHPNYGGSEATALAIDAARELDSKLPDRNHGEYLIKAGSDVSPEDATGLSETFGQNGISAIYPSIVRTYGGDAKVRRSTIKYAGNDHGFVHLSGFSFDGRSTIKMLDAGPCMTVNKMEFKGAEVDFEGCPNFVLYNSYFSKIFQEAPGDGGLDWNNAFKEKYSGLYVSSSPGSFVGYCYLDKCGYDFDTYADDASYNDGLNGQPPNLYNHNVYCNYGGTDMTFIGLISSNASSQGLQIRPGGYLEYNLCFANPMGLNNIGHGKFAEGDIEEVKDGRTTYTLQRRNITTQGFRHRDGIYQARDAKGNLGEYSAGASHRGAELTNWGASVLGDMVFNANDPNDPNDITIPKDWGIRRNLKAIGEGGDGPLAEGSYYLILNWNGSPKFLENLPKQDNFIVRETFEVNGTIQRYTDQLRGVPAGTSTTDDLIAYLDTNRDYRSFSKDAYAFFGAEAATAGDTRFAIPVTRTIPKILNAQPDLLGRTSGKWWSIPEDWDGVDDDYPGVVNGDSANMNGHRMYGNLEHAVTLANLDLGNGGMVVASGSSFEITGNLSAINTGHVGASVSGRFIFDGYSGDAKVKVSTEGGLVANKGVVAGNMDFIVQPQTFEEDWAYINRGHALLCQAGSEINFGTGDVLQVDGYTDAVLDGDSGFARLYFSAGSILRFVARGNGHSNNPYEFGMIRKKKTGVIPEASDSFAAFVYLNDTLVEVDATGMAPGTYTVMENVTDIIGSLGAVTFIGGSGTVQNTGSSITITVNP